MKKLVLIYAMMVFCLFTSACKGYPTVQPVESTNINTTDIKMLTIADDYYANSGANTSDGYYEVVTYESHCNLVYTDYTTKQQMFVCAAPQCLHNNVDCTSYIKNPFTVFLDYKSEKLLYITYDIVDELGKKFALYQMELNGENKNKIYEFKQEYGYEGGMIAADKDNIYLVMSEIKDEYKKLLISVNAAKGKQQTLAQLHANDLLLSAEKDTLYYVSIDEENKNSIIAFSIAQNISKKVYTLEKPTVKEEIIADQIFTSANYLEVFCISGDIMYVYNKTSGIIRTVNLVSLEEEKIGQIMQEQETYFARISNEQIILRQIKLGEKKDNGFVLNIGEKQISPLTLTYRESDWLNTVIPIAMDENFAIVQLGYSQEEVTLKGPGDIPYTTTAKIPKRALIRTEDYLAGHAEYLVIDDKSLMLPIS